MEEGKKLVCLFDLPRAFWSQLHIRLIEEEEVNAEALETQLAEEDSEVQDDKVAVEGELSCNTCEIPFESVEERNEHYRGDWHTFNLQRKLVGMDPITEEKFSNLISLNQNIMKEKRFLTQSEESMVEVAKQERKRKKKEKNEKERILSQKPKLTLTTSDGKKISIWRNILLVDAETESFLDEKREKEALVKAITQLHLNRKWAFFMCCGGYFAGALFDGQRVLCHKTFRRYTVRRKQGGSQATADKLSGGHQARSAGASMRRYHHAQLQREIKELLLSWKELIDSCQLVFLHTPGDNKKMVFFEGSPLGAKRGGKGQNIKIGFGGKFHPRYRSIPFTVKPKPSFEEIKRVHQWLSTVEMENVESVLPENTASQQEVGTEVVNDKEIIMEMDAVTESGIEQNKEEKEEDEEKIFVRKVLACIRQNDLDTLKRLYEWHEKGEREQILNLVIEADRGQEMPQSRQVQSTTNQNEADGKKRKKKKKKKTGQQQKQQPSTRDDFKDDEVTPLFLACYYKQLACVQFLLEKEPEPQFINAMVPAYRYQTVLHFAAEKGYGEMVALLLEHSCDPTVKSLYSSKTPYEVATTEVRNILRRFAGNNLDKWDYKAANIIPLTKEMEEEMKAKQAEKKRRQREQAKKKKQEQEKQKIVEEQKRKEEEEKRKIEEEREREIKNIVAQREKEIANTKNLSEREKRALAAEKRFIAAAASSIPTNCWICEFCKKQVGLNVTPFTRFNWKYCSVQCVKAHKEQTG